MLHNICNMARGKSGRVVIETDPDLKRRLYTQLARDEQTLKDWFTGAAFAYVEQGEQPTLFRPVPKKKPGKRQPAKDEDQ